MKGIGNTLHLFTSKKGFLVFLVLVIALVSIGATLFYAKSNPSVLGLNSSNSEELSSKDASVLLSELSKIIVLPQNETPTIATVTDIEKLKSQSFFKNAQNGDRTIIYSQSKKAILYRPSEKKIIEVGIVNVTAPSPTSDGSPSSSAAPSSTPEALSFRTVFYNGTSVTGITRTAENELKAKIPSVIVTDRAVAGKTDYDKTIVVDVSKERGEDAEEIAVALNAEVRELPAEEKKPTNADFLIIVGSDRIPAQ